LLRHTYIDPNPLSVTARISEQIRMVRHPKECRACGRKRCGFSLRECNPKRSAHGIFRFTDIGSDDTRSGGYFSAMRFTSFVGGGLIVCGGLERGRSLDGHHADEEEQQSGETQQRGTDPRCVCVCVCVCVRERERESAIALHIPYSFLTRRQNQTLMAFQWYREPDYKHFVSSHPVIKFYSYTNRSQRHKSSKLLNRVTLNTKLLCIKRNNNIHGTKKKQIRYNRNKGYPILPVAQ